MDRERGRAHSSRFAPQPAVESHGRLPTRQRGARKSVFPARRSDGEARLRCSRYRSARPRALGRRPRRLHGRGGDRRVERRDRVCTPEAATACRPHGVEHGWLAHDLRVARALDARPRGRPQLRLPRQALLHAPAGALDSPAPHQALSDHRAGARLREPVGRSGDRRLPAQPPRSRLCMGAVGAQRCQPLRFHRPGDRARSADTGDHRQSRHGHPRVGGHLLFHDHLDRSVPFIADWLEARLRV
jgi:hypothetical protein